MTSVAIWLGTSLRRFFIIAHHLLGRGTIYGYNLQLDPDTATPPRRSVLLTLIFFVLSLSVIVFGKDIGFRTSLLLIVASPLWLYAISHTKDIIMEYRAYITVIGVAMMVTLAFSSFALGLLGIVALILVNAYRSRERCDAYIDQEHYRTLAYQEAPYNARAIVNYGQVVKKRGDLLGAVIVWERALSSTERAGGTAAANILDVRLSLYRLYTQAKKANLAAIELEHCAVIVSRAFDVWPTHPLLRANVGVYFMMTGEYLRALESIDVALRDASINTRSALYFNRARVNMALNRVEDAAVDMAAFAKFNEEEIQRASDPLHAI